ncbi:MAG: hypothetical protein A2V52_00245 [Actinobacteria bacterium RBG_19FT_COMBO_54_7]|uniref:Glycosyltransferase 2-like domain-containing protein n=1 Tax=Candidatus Solincola sediminis TaxID=1797199 RepID=A0A1F2WJ41_9ACTN|nr:MAG: hypothetical protein A2Y75_06725 [Candidatus Solincola sediminis]OFW57565.1 MAG: hypothetical protein A2W01_02075 [Candidatus Solincola sediminis]OFW68495.1 MAG: hypothetical protein A2V52_00245 [Actinobacteria bacterium RBG_19FT_COMBO_54_7]
MENKASEGEYRPRVSAIIPNWNRSSDLREALLAIKAQTYPVSEIIVVDNNSSDDSVAILRGDFPEVMTICSPHNIFINSLNIAAKTASGDLILHQDNDGILASDALERLVGVLADDPSIAVAYSRNLYYDSGETYDPMRWFSEEEHLSDGVFNAPSFHGNGSLMRKDVLEEVGYFEPDIHLFERSLSAKVFDKGYRVVYHPASVIRHKISKEVRNPGYRLYVNMTGGWWFLARFYPAGKAWEKAFLYLVYFKLYSLKHRTFRDFFRGIFDTLLGLPQILRRREVVSKAAIKCLECKPYEMSMLKYGAWDTIKKSFSRKA